jgi:hypothetical protein
MKQIRLKNQTITIESCGECPFQREYSIDMDYCGALADYLSFGVAYPPCPSALNLRKDCPLEDYEIEQERKP